MNYETAKLTDKNSNELVEKAAPVKRPEGFLSVEEFAQIKGIKEEKVIQMIKDGFYQGRLIDGSWFVSDAESLSSNQGARGHSDEELGFVWWKLWSAILLTLGNMAYYIVFEREPKIALTGILLNTVLGLMILTYNKYAFLISTVLSNPVLWVINGIYLRNRWDHPQVNQNVQRVVATQ